MRLFWGIFFFCFSILGYAQIVVDTDSYTTEQLVSDILINSNCAQTSNYSSSTGLSEGVNGIGYFNANGSSFQYQEGIVLSSGNAVDSEGPNNRRYNTRPTAWTGDADLSGITLIPILFNASYIQFDFVPRTNSISFNFLFASEEYDDNYQCIFSDVFAFILTGPDGVSTNLALVPGTDEPVSATTIRPGVAGSCEPANENYFFGINDTDSPISQFGQTVSLTATSSVTPMATYTIKLVIADNSDAELDSAVYLEAGSFSIDVSLGEDRTVAGSNPLCDGELVFLDAFSEGALDYIWYRDGLELIAERNQPSITISDNGVYSVKVIFSANCVSNGAIALEYITPPVIAEEPLDLSACDLDGDGNEQFDFRGNTDIILGNQDSDVYKVYYYTSQEDAENFENEIIDTDYHSNQQNTVIYARVSSWQNCFEIASFEINIIPIMFTSDLKERYTLCLDETGRPKEAFPVLDTGLSANDYTFQWYSGSLSDENLIVGATQPAYQASEEGRYVLVLNILYADCELQLSTMVDSNGPPDSVVVNLVSELFESQNTIEIIVEGFGEYLFSVDDGPLQESNRFSGVGPGQHTANIIDVFGCSAIKEEFLIIDYPRFFTPNADGRNDTWSIIGLSQIESPEIAIYDRQGKLLHQFVDTAWDGMYNGSPLPSSDYWFKVSYVQNEARKEYKGHFSLKR